LKLEQDKQLSNFAFNFKLRRYNMGFKPEDCRTETLLNMRYQAGLTLAHFTAQCRHFIWDKGCI